MSNGAPVFQSGFITPQHLAQFVTDRVASDAGISVPGLGGVLKATALVNFNAFGDTAIPINIPSGFDKYRVNRITISGASANCSNATCAVFTRASGLGTPIVVTTNVTVNNAGADTPNNAQSLTVLNQNTVAFVDTTIYFRVLNLQGSPATATVSVFYEPLAASPAVAPTPPAPPGPISSAGVFNSNNQLVRTIWSIKTNDPRVSQSPLTWWDGTDDVNAVLPTGTYTIALLSSSCAYNWDGLVGNSAPNHSATNQAPGQVQRSTTYIRGTSVITGMAIGSGGDVYYCTTSSERVGGVFFTTTSDMSHAFLPSEWPTAGLGGGAGTLTWDQLTNAFRYPCTDGTNIYFATDYGGDAVIGVVASTHAQILFSSGDANHVAGVWTGSGSTGGGFIQSIACQAGGAGFVFITRPFDTTSGANGRIWVLNETTGAVAQKLTTVNFPQVLACSPTSGDLWVCYTASGSGPPDTIQKYTVSGTGTLTATGVTISVSGTPPLNFVRVPYMAVSTDGSTLLVMDQSTMQVRAYNTSDGSIRTGWGSSGTLGLAGGYTSNGPTVTDNKFMFNTPASGLTGVNGGFVCYAPDGSWWLGDVGNWRYLHFSSGDTPAVTERQSFMPLNYAVGLCQGDITRVFASWLEWHIDYTKSIDAVGAWTLANNWTNFTAIGLAGSYSAMFEQVGVFSNGRTYGIAINGNTALWDIFELDPANGLRLTGKATGNGSRVDIPSFDLFTADEGNGGFFGAPGGGFLYRNPFTGFDGSNNPTWAGNPALTANSWSSGSPASGWVIVVQSQALPSRFPPIEIFHPPLRPLANNVLPLFKFRPLLGVSPPGGPQNAWVYQYGGIDASTGLWKYQNGPPSLNNNGGPNTADHFYPDAPYNSSMPGSSDTTNYSGPAAYVPGHTDMFTNYRGEGWGNGQVNIWSHWHQSGLAVGRFGATLPFFAAFPLSNPNKNLNGDSLPTSAGSFFFQGEPGAAGNLEHVAFGYDPNNSDLAYLYHVEEWPHSGIHRWTVSGLNSVQLVTVATVNWNSGSYVPPAGTPGDLLFGLPYNTPNITGGAAGWTCNAAQIGTWPNDPVNGGGGTANWILSTNTQKNDPHDSPDIHNFISVASGTPGGFGVLPLQAARSIPRVKTTDWTLTISAYLYRPGGSDAVGDGNAWTANSVNIPANNVGQVYNGQWLDIVDGGGKRIVSIFTGGYANAARSIPQFSVSIWVNERATIPIADMAWASPLGNPLSLYAAGGYQNYTSEPIVWDGSQLHHLPVLTISSNILANTITVSYGRASKIATVTVPVYDAGASITGITSFQINYKSSPANTAPVNCGIGIMSMQYTEA